MGWIEDSSSFKTQAGSCYPPDEGPLPQGASEKQKAFQHLRMKLTWAKSSAPNSNRQGKQLDVTSSFDERRSQIPVIHYAPEWVDDKQWKGLCRLAQPDIFAAFTVDSQPGPTLISDWLTEVAKYHNLADDDGRWNLLPLTDIREDEISDDLAKACWPNGKKIIDLLNGTGWEERPSLKLKDFYDLNHLTFHPQVTLHHFAQLLWPTTAAEVPLLGGRGAKDLGFINRYDLLSCTALRRHCPFRPVGTPRPRSFLAEILRDEIMKESLAKALGISLAFLLWLFTGEKQEAISTSADEGLPDHFHKGMFYKPSPSGFESPTVSVYTFSRVREECVRDLLEIAAGSRAPPDSARSGLGSFTARNIPPTSGRSVIIVSEPVRRGNMRLIMKGHRLDPEKGKLKAVWYSEQGFRTAAYPPAPVHQLGLTKEWIDCLNETTQDSHGQLELVDSWKEAVDTHNTFGVFKGDRVLFDDAEELMEIGIEVKRRPYPSEVLESTV